MGFLDINHVTKAYGAVEVLHDVNIAVEEGEFLVLVGPSGCGKSTLLNMIAGLEDITTGEISIKGAVMNGVHPSKAQHRHGVPELCALPEHDGRPKHHLRSGNAWHAKG
jgi:ABC-type sugar transport system ATPase subunit